ncbi:MAG: MBL fold metallo-hydrolase [Candidatus Heimdallarchaeota archaeon]|nr:MBL fold metallo-hydrolase [Candidatus Heimdallarchaeota archaeon]
MRILDDIYVVPGFVNSYLIEREHHSVLIDTGMSKQAKKVIQTIKSFFPDKPLKGIIITHAHQDHIAGLETLGQLYGSTVIAHKEESDYIMKIKKMPTRDGFIGKMISFFSKLSSTSGYTVDQVVSDYEVICGLKVFHLPGHTPGSIALEDVESHALFCSDILNTDKKGKKLLPPNKSFALDYEKALQSSLKLLRESKPSVILPGHGAPLFEPEEAIKEYLEEYS